MFACVPTRLRQDPNITGSHIAVYYELATYANPETKSCWPGRERVAKELQFSVRKVYGLIRDLEDLGYIKVTKGSHKTLNYYLVPINELPPIVEPDVIENDDVDATVTQEIPSEFEWVNPATGNICRRGPAIFADKQEQGEQDQENLSSTNNLSTSNVDCKLLEKKKILKEKEKQENVSIEKKVKVSASSLRTQKINKIKQSNISELSVGEKLCKAFWEVCDKVPSTYTALENNWLPTFDKLALDGKTPGEVKFAARKLQRKFRNPVSYNPMNLAKWWDELIDGQKFVTVNGVTRPLGTGDSEAWMSKPYREKSYVQNDDGTLTFLP
jgi:hypothetical protein